MAEPTSETIPAGNPMTDAVARNKIGLWLGRTSNVALAVALIGCPLTYYDQNGYGPSLSFAGIVLYLLLRRVRSRF